MRASSDRRDRHRLHLIEVEPGGAFSHSPDYASVTMRGQTFSLTSHHRLIVEELHRAREEGNPDRSSALLAERIDRSQGARGKFRLRQDVFKRNKEAFDALNAKYELRSDETELATSIPRA